MTPGTSPASGYRADIDGLRALAVVAVILCHLGLPVAAGGYLGVDVFFVISGYLIHRDLVRRVAARDLAVGAFYARRLRRTLPALYVTAAATFVASLFVLLPTDLVALARSLLGALAGVSNVVFWQQVGYFDAGAATKPLLHTWSLGVEEQFYLLAPLVALGLSRCPPRARLVAMVAGVIVAFALALALGALDRAAAFYLVPARLFEFLIGAAVAERWLPPIRRSATAEVVAGLAVAALAFGFVGFDAATPHPGWATLLPCLGTAALIHVGAGRRTRVGAALSTAVPVALGRISYSLYLVHWPVLVLAHYAGWPDAWPWRLGELAAILALSAASYRWVEQPFRAPDTVLRRRAGRILPAGAAALAACCAATLAFTGFAGRFPPQIAAVAAYADFGESGPFDQGRCFLTSREAGASLDPACLALSTDRPNILVLGDSHAAHLVTGLRAAWPGANVMQATASGCLPVLGASGASRCTRTMRDMLEQFVPDHRLDAVILSALWSEADIASLRRTVETLRRKARAVIVFGPLPRYDVPAATLLARAVMQGDLGAMARHRLASTQRLDADMRAALAPVATYVSLLDAMCPRGDCRLFASPDVPMQFDYHHLTPPGSRALMATVAARHPDLLAPTGAPSDRPAADSPNPEPSAGKGGSPDRPRSSGGAG